MFQKLGCQEGSSATRASQARGSAESFWVLVLGGRAMRLLHQSCGQKQACCMPFACGEVLLAGGTFAASSRAPAHAHAAPWGVCVCYRLAPRKCIGQSRRQSSLCPGPVQTAGAGWRGLSRSDESKERPQTVCRRAPPPAGIHLSFLLEPASFGSGIGPRLKRCRSILA